MCEVHSVNGNVSSFVVIFEVQIFFSVFSLIPHNDNALTYFYKKAQSMRHKANLPKLKLKSRKKWKHKHQITMNWNFLLEIKMCVRWVHNANIPFNQINW